MFGELALPNFIMPCKVIRVVVKKFFFGGGKKFFAGKNKLFSQDKEDCPILE